MKGKKVCSKVDLVRRYNQIPVAAANVPKTAVIMPFGLFEFLCMPFGLDNATQAFQRFMDSPTELQHRVLNHYLSELRPSVNFHDHRMPKP